MTRPTPRSPLFPYTTLFRSEFTAAENVGMPLFIRRVQKELALERAKQLLSEVGLGARLEHQPGELSGGERQRCAFARALRSEEHTSELQSQFHLVCRLLLEK